MKFLEMDFTLNIRWIARSKTAYFFKKLALLGIIFIFQSCSQESSSKLTETKNPFLVKTILVQEKDVPVSFEYVAQTQSSQLVNIQARISGFLDKRVYTEGQMVKKGQVLFLMDKKPFEVQLDAANAALERQKAAFETAKLNLDRVQPLVKLNALSQKDLDDAKGTFETSSASVWQATAGVETAKLNLSYCTITSPIEGITSAALQQEGSYINVTNSQLTTVALLSPIWVNFSVSENELQSFLDEVKAGKIIPPKDGLYEVKIVLVNNEEFPHVGKITFTEPYYNPQTGTFLIRASVDNPKGVLRPNQFVRVKVMGAIRPKAILIPQKAVQQSSKGHFVFVINQNEIAEMRPVTLGSWLGEEWFILEGLKALDRVVIEGGIYLQPGDKVKENKQD